MTVNLEDVYEKLTEIEVRLSVLETRMDQTVIQLSQKQLLAIISTAVGSLAAVFTLT